MASRLHSALMASRVKRGSFIFRPLKPSPIPDKPSTLPTSNSIFSGSMIGVANYPFYLSRSSFSLSRKGFDPTYEVFPRRMFSVNAKTKKKATTSDALPKPQEPSISKLPHHPKPATVNGTELIKLKPLYPPVGKSVVVVESPTKAKVIQRYLGDTYQVLPSYGHVRDLAASSGSVRPDDDFSMVWEVPSCTWIHLNSIKFAINGADNLILASDPDREGESIAWHIIEMLQQQNALHKDVTIARVSFQEITESAVKRALQTPRDIDVNLVHAYLA